MKIIVTQTENPNGIRWRVINIFFFLVTLIFILFYISLRSYWPDLNGSLKIGLFNPDGDREKNLVGSPGLT